MVPNTKEKLKMVSRMVKVRNILLMDIIKVLSIWEWKKGLEYTTTKIKKYIKGNSREICFGGRVNIHLPMVIASLDNL